MILRLFEDQMRALARRENILPQVDGIDGLPNVSRSLASLVDGERGIAVEIRRWILKDGLLKHLKAIDVPLPDVRLLGVDENREIEEVGNERSRRPHGAAVA